MIGAEVDVILGLDFYPSIASAFPPAINDESGKRRRVGNKCGILVSINKEGTKRKFSKRQVIASFIPAPK